jgi:uncharacterized membrane protein SpoIIM required for sporulation
MYCSERGIVATVDELVRSRRHHWEQLAALLARAASDPRRLHATEIEQLSRLYRLVASDLALARRDFPHDPLVSYLNGLAVRAYPLVYRAPVGSWQRLAAFFLVEFPARYRAAWPFILAAFLLFAVPGVVGFMVVTGDPQLAESILPATMTRGVREGRLWTEMSPASRPFFASMIATNNIQVAVLALAGGMLLGTLTVYAMVLNGLLFGAVLGYTHLYGLSGDLLGFVSPHGYLELTVIFIAGGGGLRMAWAIVQPGLLRRRDALIRAAQDAVLLVVGALPILVAGLIEGFISPSSLPNGVKYTVGLLTGSVLHLFLLGPAVWTRLGLKRRQAANRMPASSAA